MSTTSDHFPTDAAGPSRGRAARGGRARRRRRVRPADRSGGQADRRRDGADARLQRLDPRPDPARCKEGSEIVVNVENQGDMEATVHWHGLRLENRYDGTHETQAPIPVGEQLHARVAFPDPGVYWYHPHIREDYGQEMGLYGNVIVEPAEPDYWPPVHRELVLTLDDILIEDGKVAPFSRAETTHSAMGRFGNVLLVGGETDSR